MRFTLDGSDALENRLAQICADVLAGVRSVVPRGSLEALVLGGGYGRGQGGVLKSASGDLPYNDMEFYVFTRGNRLWNERRFRNALQQLGDQLSPGAGLHVEFKVDSLARLRRSPVTMFSYDLVSGHRVLAGQRKAESPVFSGCEHHLDAARIPASEATRLLLNRCTGLLLVKELLRRDALTREESDFIGRNLAKAQLALGDAVLAASERYHWSCLERRERLALAELGGNGVPERFEEIRRHHAAGVEFKLHPRCALKTSAEFRAEYETISQLASELWLWLEARRLNTSFATIHEYAFSPARKCGENGLWRNLILNAKALRLGGLKDRMALRYPRERLLNSLPLLLWDGALNDLRVKCHLQNQLRTPASDWQSLVAAYKSIWPRFS